MKAPVILSDLVLIAPDGAQTPLLTFTSEDAGRRVLVAIKGEQGRQAVVLADGGDVGLVPRPATIEVASIDAATAAGHAIDHAVLADIYARVEAADDATREKLGLEVRAAEPAPAEVAEVGA
jgi:hypothetical protein